MGVGYSIDIDVRGRVSRRSENRVVSFIIGFMDGEEELGFINGFINEKGSGSPVNNWVGGSKPGEFKDDIVFERCHVECYFMEDSFDVGEEGTGIFNVALFVRRSISVSRGDRVLEFQDREVVSFNEVIVDTRNISATVNEGIGVNGFQGVQRYDQL